MLDYFSSSSKAILCARLLCEVHECDWFIVALNTSILVHVILSSLSSVGCESGKRVIPFSAIIRSDYLTRSRRIEFEIIFPKMETLRKTHITH